MREIIPQVPTGQDPNLRVSNFINESNLQWDVVKLKECLPSDLAIRALQIPISLIGAQDKFHQPFTRDG